MRSILPFFFLFPSLCAQSYQLDTFFRALDSVTVTATRLESRNWMPRCLTVISKEQIQAGQQQLALNESLPGSPTNFNADNFAQDARIAVRGFGARSAFGIRAYSSSLTYAGVDTRRTGQVDNIDPGVLASAEVIRNVFRLYGNAAGGVISSPLKSRQLNLLPILVQCRKLWLPAVSTEGGGRKGKLGVIAYGSHTRLEGPGTALWESSLFQCAPAF